ncbi:MAG: P-loop NTPase [Desulfurococcaceae archaeon]
MSKDPRILKAYKNLREPDNVYVIISSKGGVGKTTVSVLLAIYSSSMGYSTGLLDLDFVNPSTHVILGLKPEDIKYVEKRGILPFNIFDKLNYFTIISYTKDNPIALRGSSAKSALWEILSVINWGRLDALFIDTPPGVGDEHLELLYELKDLLKPVVVSPSSQIALNSTRKTIEILKELGYRQIYFIENMSTGKLRDYAEKLGVIYLGFVPFSQSLEFSLGDLNKLLELELKYYMGRILEKLFGKQLN